MQNSAEVLLPMVLDASYKHEPNFYSCLFFPLLYGLSCFLPQLTSELYTEPWRVVW